MKKLFLTAMYAVMAISTVVSASNLQEVERELTEEGVSYISVSRIKTEWVHSLLNALDKDVSTIIKTELEPDAQGIANMVKMGVLEFFQKSEISYYDIVGINAKYVGDIDDTPLFMQRSIVTYKPGIENTVSGALFNGDKNLHFNELGEFPVESIYALVFNMNAETIYNGLNQLSFFPMAVLATSGYLTDFNLTLQDIFASIKGKATFNCTSARIYVAIPDINGSVTKLLKEVTKDADLSDVSIVYGEKIISFTVNLSEEELSGKKLKEAEMFKKMVSLLGDDAKGDLVGYFDFNQDVNNELIKGSIYSGAVVMSVSNERSDSIGISGGAPAVNLNLLTNLTAIIVNNLAIMQTNNLSARELLNSNTKEQENE